MGSGGALNVFNLANESVAEGYSLANRFSVAVAYTLYGVRWARHVDAPFPTTLYLYDSTTSTVVATYSPAAGDWWQVDTEWWDYDAVRAGGATASLVAGHTYYLTYYLGAANSWQRYNGSDSPQTGVTFLDSRFELSNTSHPATAASGAHGVDLRVVPWPEPSRSGTAPTTDTTLDGGLAAWLSNDSGVNVHQTDGLPWQTKVDTADTRTRVTNGLNLAGGLQALSDSLAGTLQMAGDYVAGRTATYFADLKNRLIGASGGGGSAFYGPDGTQVAAGVEALVQRSTNAQVGFPASPWERTAETDFDDCLAWSEPADLYTLTFATLPPTIPDNGKCGVPVRYRLAWWTPLNGEFAQDRRWVDFEKTHLIDQNGRMPGLLLYTYYGGTGHVEAWQRNV